MWSQSLLCVWQLAGVLVQYHLLLAVYGTLKMTLCKDTANSSATVNEMSWKHIQFSCVTFIKDFCRYVKLRLLLCLLFSFLCLAVTWMCTQVREWRGQPLLWPATPVLPTWPSNENCQVRFKVQTLSQMSKWKNESSNKPTFSQCF